MSRRILPLLALVAVVAPACGPGDVQVSTPPPEELGFIRQVIDVQGDVGAGISIAADADGVPHLAYLAFEPEAEQGEQPEPDPTAPLFPAVRHAHPEDDVWTRSSVAEELQIRRRDTTAIAVDGDGVHHVAWTEGNEVRYASNAGGSFSEPERVVQAAASGISVAAANDGTPSISYYEAGGDAEGPGALVRVATRGGGAWEVETAAEANAAEGAITDLELGPRGAIVAYGSAGTTLIARDQGQRWASEQVDQGGLGVSLDLDADGNPHVSYYTSDGAVRHAHAVGGSPWETSDVADAGGAPEAGWVTSISLDADGVHWVAWQGAEGLAAASNEGGSFEPQELRGSANGTRPQIAAGAEGTVYVAWHDTEERNVNLSVLSDEEPLLAAPPAGEGGTPAPGPTGTDGGGGGPPPCEPDGTELAITAPVGAVADGFDKDCLAAPAGEDFTIEFDNQDEGVPHNVAIYVDDSAAEELFKGEVITAPDQITYEPDPIEETGNFFFRCDVHPTTMTGTFVVQ